MKRRPARRGGVFFAECSAAGPPASLASEMHPLGCFFTTHVRCRELRLPTSRRRYIFETPPGDPRMPTDREKVLETERDALATALERAKQHVGVLQARRDMLRDEVATLRARLGVGGKVTSGDEKPIAK